MEDLQTKYDALCYYIFNGLQNLSHGANSINLKNFDGKNEEHLLVVAVAAACISILGDRNIAIDGPMGIRRRLAAKYKKSATIVKNQNKDKQIDVPEFLDGLRGYACELCGNEFRFSDIYHAYYCEKGEDK
jgi:hypothetical protein